MRVRPRRIEVHVHRERAGPPDTERGEKRPPLTKILSREPVRNPQAEKTVQRGHHGHGDEIRRRKSVSEYVSAQPVPHQHSRMGHHQEGRPKNRRAYGPEIDKVPGPRVLTWTYLSAFIHAPYHKAFVPVPPVLLKAKVFLNQ